MCCGVKIRLTKRSPTFERELARIDELWSEGLTRFGGPYLAGAEFTAVDAMFCPVAFRVQSYALQLSASAAKAAETLLNLPAMKQWYAEAIAETFRDQGHEADLEKFGTVLEDIRARAG